MGLSPPTEDRTRRPGAEERSASRDPTKLRRAQSSCRVLRDGTMIHDELLTLSCGGESEVLKARHSCLFAAFGLHVRSRLSKKWRPFSIFESAGVDDAVVVFRKRSHAKGIGAQGCTWAAALTAGPSIAIARKRPISRGEILAASPRSRTFPFDGSFPTRLRQGKYRVQTTIQPSGRANRRFR